MIGEEAVTDDLAYDSQCGTGDLFYASRRGHLRRVRQIVEREGGNVNAVRWSGVSPLHRAAGEGNLEICKYLIKRGADPNAKTTFGWHTPLHFATKNGREEVCKFLIEKGAVWKVYNKDRETPQNWARKGGYANMGRTLEHLVNTAATKHRRAKMQEMEAQFAEKRRLAEMQKKAEEEEERRKEEEEEDRRKKYVEGLLQQREEMGEGGSGAKDDYEGVDESKWAQKPVNLDRVYYVRKGRRSSFIYNRLINDSLIVQPKRFGATAEMKSAYVVKDKVDIAGVTDTTIKSVGQLSRHMRASKQNSKRQFRMSHHRQERNSLQVPKIK